MLEVKFFAFLDLGKNSLFMDRRYLTADPLEQKA